MWFQRAPNCGPPGNSGLFVRRESRRQHGPALVEQRDAAGREARREDHIDGVGLRAVGDARGGDGQEFVVHHVDESRGAKRSVGLSTSVLPQRMNCLPASTVSLPRV